MLCHVLKLSHSMCDMCGICRSMFVSDRSFFMRDPARSLYSTAAYYLSIMTVNAAVTIINAAFLVLLMYGMIGECCPSSIASMMTGIAVCCILLCQVGCSLGTINFQSKRKIVCCANPVHTRPPSPVVHIFTGMSCAGPACSAEG